MFVAEKPEEQKTWTLYFDGALNSKGKGVRVILTSLEGIIIPRAYQLAFPATHNIEEYEALISGLRMPILLNVKYLRIIGDSELVIGQNVNKYKAINLKLIPYHELVIVLLKQFKKATHMHVSRAGNILADALANLSSAFNFPINASTETIIIQKMEEPLIHYHDFLFR